MDVFQRQKAKKVNKRNAEGGRCVEEKWIYWFNIYDVLRNPELTSIQWREEL